MASLAPLRVTWRNALSFFGWLEPPHLAVGKAGLVPSHVVGRKPNYGSKDPISLKELVLSQVLSYFVFFGISTVTSCYFKEIRNAQHNNFVVSF